MKISGFFLSAAIALFCILEPVPGAGQNEEYTQSYLIFINGELSGTENVKETRGADGDLVSVSDHEIYVTSGTETNRMAFTTKMVFAKGKELVSYTYQYTSGDAKDSYSVDIKDGQITRVLNRSGQTSEISAALTPEMVIFDFNVYHQLDYLMRRYDEKKGGRQSFANFIPVVGYDLPLALTFLNRERLKSASGELNIRTFRIEQVRLGTGELALDEKGRLVRLSIPAQNLQVFRKDIM